MNAKEKLGFMAMELMASVNGCDYVPPIRSTDTRKYGFEKKKCKSCRKFNTDDCHRKYINPLTIACEEYKKRGDRR